jgi:nuclear pore complex protein Nup50
VVVRAGTSLGNILLNVLVTDSVPVERVGENNVMIICLPNPPIDLKADPEPVTFLLRSRRPAPEYLLNYQLRVKTAEDADELWEQIAGQGKEVLEYNGE